VYTWTNRAVTDESGVAADAVDWLRARVTDAVVRGTNGVLGVDHRENDAWDLSVSGVRHAPRRDMRGCLATAA
jgi:hypothetical protein